MIPLLAPTANLLEDQLRFSSSRTISVHVPEFLYQLPTHAKDTSPLGNAAVRLDSAFVATFPPIDYILHGFGGTTTIHTHLRQCNPLRPPDLWQRGFKNTLTEEWDGSSFKSCSTASVMLFYIQILMCTYKPSGTICLSHTRKSPNSV